MTSVPSARNSDGTYSCWFTTTAPSRPSNCTRIRFGTPHNSITVPS